MNNTIAKVFEEIASAIESGSFAPKKKVALTTLGSEHGEETLLEGAKLAKKLYPNMEIVLIGKKNDTLRNGPKVENHSYFNGFFMHTNLIKECIKC